MYKTIKNNFRLKTHRCIYKDCLDAVYIPSDNHKKNYRQYFYNFHLCMLLRFLHTR